ncbi:MAG TPA: M3 family oligoendopeptidase [Firmicutes bacterium]|nr:M3 family oligoendopeptidase [Bacillota bacterium]
MKFSEMIYERPDIDGFNREGLALVQKMEQATSYAEALQAFEAFEHLSNQLETMYSLTYIRHEIDTADPFYDAEMNFLDESIPLTQETQQKMTLALLNSPFRADFEKEYGTLLIKNAEIALKAFSPEIIPELQEENRLVTEYSKLIASAQIPFDGQTRTLSQLSPYKQSADDSVRLAAWKADGNFYTEHGETLDRLYDDLVRVRNRMAQKLGYDNYIPLGYYRMMRNSYTQEDVKKFRAAVVKYLVPVADRLFREQAERTGAAYPLNFADEALTFRSGNAAPKGTPDQILAHGQKMYHEMSAETAEFIDFMYQNELLDVLSRKGKAGGGFCTDLPLYKSPFIFANFNGTSHDVEVITHEAGHAFASYMARDIRPRGNQSPTLESCEIHSMSMEFFAWPWAEGFFREDTNKFYYGHLAGALTFIPYGTMVDHFQHLIYADPDMTPEERHRTWRELLGVYMPWMRLGEIPFYGDGKGWQRQSHIYERPFYYIDYCLAQTVALQFWTVMQTDRTDAWNRYLRLVKKAGTETFDGLVSTAGLDTPFGDAALQKVAEAAGVWLDHADKEALR